MMNSIIEKIRSNSKSDNHNLRYLISLIEIEYPDKDLDNPEVLKDLLNENFGIEVTVLDIYNFYICGPEDKANSVDELDETLMRKNIFYR